MAPRLLASAFLFLCAAPLSAQNCVQLGEKDGPAAVAPLVKACEDRLTKALEEYASEAAAGKRAALSKEVNAEISAMISLRSSANYFEGTKEILEPISDGITDFLRKNDPIIEAARTGKPAPEKAAAGGADVGAPEPQQPAQTPEASEQDLRRKAAKGEPIKPQQYVDVANKLLEKGDAAGAERLADEALKGNEKDSGALAARAAARLSQGKSAGALDDARKALALDPKNMTARDIAGYIHPGPDMKLRTDPRKQAFNGLSDQAPVPGKTGILGENGKGGPAPVIPKGKMLTQSELLVQRAGGKLGLHDYTGALLAATEAIDADPKNAAAWALRAEISNRLKNYAAAVKDADEALRLDPRNAQALRARSRTQYESGDYRKAFADADAAVKLEPKNALGYLYRAMAEEKLGDAEGAALDYQRAEKLDPSLKPLCEEALKNLGVEAEDGAAPPVKVPKRLLLRGGSILTSLILVLLGLEGGRRVATTLNNRKAQRRAPAVKQADGTIDSGMVLGGNFRVVGELGRGGMGVVYEAFDLALERRVAIKQLRRDADTTQADFDRFLKEARMMAKLKHPNLAEIYSIIEDEDFYLVFEHIDGKTLDSNLAERGRLPLPEARKLLGDICKALDYAHAQKIVHRDLKPANIMIRADGRAKVMDFGIAHQSQSLSGQTLTSASGTPVYMAPEQCFGSASPAADVYALGVMTYELLTGARPFSGPDLLGDKLAERYVPASRANASLPPGIDALFASALKADPAKRLASAEEFLKALDRASKSV